MLENQTSIPFLYEIDQIIQLTSYATTAFSPRCVTKCFFPITTVLSKVFHPLSPAGREEAEKRIVSPLGVYLGAWCEHIISKRCPCAETSMFLANFKF